MLKIGEKLPEFTGKNQDGKEISSSNFLGKKLVVFFYPQASTPTCTIEACNLSDNYSDLEKAGYQLLGISADTEKKQKNFHTKFSFPYDLLADENKEVVGKFGVWQEKKNFGKTYMGIVRTTYLIDEEGTIIKADDKVKAKENPKQMLEEL